MAALAQGLGGQSTVDEEIRKMAEHPPLSMEFKGGTAGAKKYLEPLDQSSDKLLSRALY
jgi:hypothetical protein